MRSLWPFPYLLRERRYLMILTVMAATKPVLFGRIVYGYYTSNMSDKGREISCLWCRRHLTLGEAKNVYNETMVKIRQQLKGTIKAKSNA